MTPLLLLPLALAATPPQVEVTPPDTVVGVIDVSASVDAVRAQLADPTWVARTSGGKTTVNVVEKDDTCMVADFTSPNPIVTVEYRVRRCADAKGYEATMLESNAFKDYRTRWEVAPHGDGGTRITYTIQLTTSLWGVPNSMVISATRKSVVQMLEKVGAALEGPSGG